MRFEILQQREFVLEILKMLLNWPVTGAVLVLYFLRVFKKPVEELLQGLYLSKLGPAAFSPRQSEQPPQVGDEASHKAGAAMVTEEQNYEFLYLSSFLVENSKNALLWLSKVVNGATREHFMNYITVPANLILAADQLREKQAIFSVLMANNLIEEKDGLVKVTSKAKSFLKFLKFI